MFAHLYEFMEHAEKTEEILGISSQFVFANSG